eukprot:Em0020g656a
MSGSFTKKRSSHSSDCEQDFDGETKRVCLLSTCQPASPPISTEGQATSHLSPASPLIERWWKTFTTFSAEHKMKALQGLVPRCGAAHLKYLMELIRPQFQRDFILLLPKELALHVLSFLDARDLLVAAQTCRTWYTLCEDSLLWKDKCKDFDQDELNASMKSLAKRKSLVSIVSNPWKQLYLRKHRIAYNWRHADMSEPNRTRTLKGHEDHVVTCLQFFGNRIVSGSDDNTLRIWSASTGKHLKTLMGHTGGVWCSQFDGVDVVSGSTDRTLRVWNAETGVCRFILHGHTSTVRCMSMSGKIVVSGSRDASLRVWDIETGKCKQVLQGHIAAVRCVQFDGHYAVSGAYDYLVKVWDPLQGTCVHTLQGHTNRVYSLRFDGVHIVSGSLDTSIRVWNVETGQCIHTLTGHQSLTSGMELKKHILVSGNADSTVKVWNIISGHCLHTLQGSNKHQSAVTSLQFTDDFIITSSDDGTVKLWDLNTGEFIRDLVALDTGGSGGVVWRVRCSDRKLVCAIGSRNGVEDTRLLVLNFDV